MAPRALARGTPNEPMNPPAVSRPSWLQRASAWVHRVNRKRLARRRARKQRAIDRVWFHANDPHRPDVARALQQRLAACSSEVRFSVLLWPPGGDAHARQHALRDLAQSMHPHWELLWPRDGADDAAIDPHLRLFEAGGSTGPELLEAALLSATGTHLALLPHGWTVAPHALLLAAEAADRFAHARLIYGDDGRVGWHGQPHSPDLRCDWNRELLRSTPYIDGLVVVRRDAWQPVADLHALTPRAAWWALLLRWTEPLLPSDVLHIPHVLAHRVTREYLRPELPQASDTELAVVQAHLDRSAPGARAQRGSEGGVHVRYPVPEVPPRVSLIIPTRNGLQVLRQCIASIVDKTDYPNYELLIVDNASDDPATLEYLRSLAGRPRMRVVRDERPFNFSALNNAAARSCSGELLALVNNDIEVISGDWLREMVGLALRPDVGAVGARLWFPDETLQHAGVVLGIGGVAGHVHRQLPRGQPGYQGRACVTQEFSAVTAACMVLRKAVFDALGGLDENHLAVDYNDIDFCLRIRSAGYRVVWTPHAQLYHHESATRGQRRPPEQQQRYDSEVAFMQSTWGPWLHNDPAYNPNLNLRRTDFLLAEQPRVNLIEPWYEQLVPLERAAPGA
jgi:GT2 family glycosyltransferase